MYDREIMSEQVGKVTLPVYSEIIDYVNTVEQ
jgi:hypothetical protein